MSSNKELDVPDFQSNISLKLNKSLKITLSDY